MKRRAVPLAGLSSLLTSLALAQSPAAIVLPDLPAASAPGLPASAAPGRQAAPRLRSPAETGAGAAVPGELKPERPVAPQITLPFGKKAAPPTSRETRAVDRGQAATSGGVDDAAARCEGQVDPRLRAACLAKPVAHGASVPVN